MSTSEKSGEKAPEAAEAAVVKPKAPSKIGSIAYEKVSYRQWMIGRALEALLTRNGPYKDTAKNAITSVDDVLAILDAESESPKVG